MGEAQRYLSLFGGKESRLLDSPRFLPVVAAQSTRWLSIHEYQNMSILKEHELVVPRGDVAETVEDVKRITSGFGGQSVIKAQVLAGGRGKGHFTSGLQGGVKLARSIDEAVDYAKQMLGSRLVTKQTGEKGRPCNKVLVTEVLKPQREFYFAIIMDRSVVGPVIIASKEGGVDIEDVAKNNPDALVKEPVSLNEGLTEEKASKVATLLGFEGDLHSQAVDQFRKLYKVFTEFDTTMVEINPLAVDASQSSERVMCMDVKISFDDNAAFRHQDVHNLRDWSQEDPREVMASKAGLNYIGLDGDIGCLVNGAGLAMATMDLIKLYGGQPANFLDIGGGASTEEVLNAFEVISSDRNVRSILVNIFGGIIKCDEIAQGIISAHRSLGLKLPLVVRLQGTNFLRAKELISESGLNIELCEEFGQSAKMAVELAK